LLIDDGCATEPREGVGADGPRRAPPGNTRKQIKDEEVCEAGADARRAEAAPRREVCPKRSGSSAAKRGCCWPDSWDFYTFDDQQVLRLAAYAVRVGVGDDSTFSVRAVNAAERRDATLTISGRGAAAC
jgi:hypothetical protein